MYSEAICDFVLIKFHFVFQNLPLEDKSHLFSLNCVLLGGTFVFELLDSGIRRDLNLELVTTALSQYNLNLGIFHYLSIVVLYL